MRFYSVQLGDLVVDALCECGHLKRNHGSKLQKMSCGRSVRYPHDGNCCKQKCVCPRFRWERWVTATEMEKTITPKHRKRLAKMR